MRHDAISRLRDVCPDGALLDGECGHRVAEHCRLQPDEPAAENRTDVMRSSC